MDVRWKDLWGCLEMGTKVFVQTHGCIMESAHVSCIKVLYNGFCICSLYRGFCTNSSCGWKWLAVWSDPLGGSLSDVVFLRLTFSLWAIIKPVTTTTITWRPVWSCSTISYIMSGLPAFETRGILCVLWGGHWLSPTVSISIGTLVVWRRWTSLQSQAKCPGFPQL